MQVSSLPISPFIAPNITEPIDVQRVLFQLSYSLCASHDTRPFCEILREIHTSAVKIPKLHLTHHLLGTDAVHVAHALREIASREEMILELSRSERICRALSEIEKNTRIDITEESSVSDLSAVGRLPVQSMVEHPYFSRTATLQVIYDFNHMSIRATRSLLTAPGCEMYDSIMETGALRLFEKLGSRRLLLHSERLTDIEKRKKNGAKVIVISNHRSHLDVLLLFAYFHSLFMTKKELAKIFLLGKNPFNHPTRPSQWFADSLIGGKGHPLLDREGGHKAYLAAAAMARKGIEAGLTIVWFLEGTRAKTPNRFEEVGVRAFFDGAFNFAAELEGDVLIVPVVNYGPGQIIPNDYSALLQGTKKNQPIITDIGEFIEVSSFRGQEDNPSETSRNLKEEVLRRFPLQLGRMQAVMNHPTHTHLAEI